MPKQSMEEINQRRRLMFSLVSRGMSPTQAARKLAEKYDVAFCTIKSDWSKRDEWMPKIFDLDNPQKIVLDLVVELKDIKSEMWSNYSEIDNPKVKVDVLKEIKEMDKDILSTLQSIGAVPKAAEKLMLTGQEEENDIIDITPREKLEKELDKLEVGDVDGTIDSGESSSTTG